MGLSLASAGQRPASKETSMFPGDNGQEWIRTTEGVSQRIYSPPRLATSVPTRFCEGAFYTRVTVAPQEFVSKNLPPGLGLRWRGCGGRRCCGFGLAG